jgi:hypothetical protein
VGSNPASRAIFSKKAISSEMAFLLSALGQRAGKRPTTLPGTTQTPLAIAIRAGWNEETE